MLATSFSWDVVVSLVSLTAMEIVLGIDNIVFLTILSGRLPESEQGRARKTGLALALLMRLGLLFAISWVIGLTATLFTVFEHAVSGRDLILLGGGLFLVAKATIEIHEKLEVPAHEGAKRRSASFRGVIVQIMLLDIVFSLDSVITAVGMVEHLWVMIVAMVTAVAVMLVFVNPISAFVTRHPSMKILALSFLILIGVMLVVEGTGGHVERGFVYFAMAFSLAVEILNMRMRRVRQPVALHEHFAGATKPPPPATP